MSERDIAGVYPYRLIRHGTNPTTASPEPGWSSCCTHDFCSHWRTGFATEDQALNAYDKHECGGRAMKPADEAFAAAMRPANEDQ